MNQNDSCDVQNVQDKTSGSLLFTAADTHPVFAQNNTHLHRESKNVSLHISDKTNLSLQMKIAE